MAKLVVTHTSGSSIATPDTSNTALFIQARKDNSGNGDVYIKQPDGTIEALGGTVNIYSSGSPETGSYEQYSEYIDTSSDGRTPYTYVNGRWVAHYNGARIIKEIDSGASGSVYTLLPQIESASFAPELIYWVSMATGSGFPSSEYITFSDIDGDGAEAFQIETHHLNNIKRIVYPDAYTAKKAIDLNDNAWTVTVSGSVNSATGSIKLVAVGQIIDYKP